MLRNFRIWLNKPLADALEALETDQCALTKRQDALQQAWVEAETNLDGTYRRVHSELGYIDKRSADLRKLELAVTEEDTNGFKVGPFAGGRRAHAARRTR